MPDADDQLEVRSRAQWRAWLEVNHDRSAGLWLVTFKKGQADHVAYGDVVEEALCFGWVDSRPRKIDEQRTALLVTPRKPSSRWSSANKARVGRLTEAGRMAPSGLAAVAAAQASGTWNALDDVEALVEPDDLRAALDAVPVARASWNDFPRSAKRGILEWILSAKRPSTRNQRIHETVTEAAAGRRANRWPRT